MLSQEDRALQWLRKEKLIEWTSEQFSERPYAQCSVTVTSPALEQAMDWNWSWSVEEELGPSHMHEDDIFSLAVPFDYRLQMLLPSKGWGRPLEARLVGPNLQLQIDPGIDDDRGWALYQGTDPWSFEGEIYPGSAWLETIEEREWLVAGVWTPESISEALTEWAFQVAHRRIEFRYNSELEGYQPRGEFYQLTENTVASSDLVDSLLEIPSSHASQITSALEKLAKAHQ